MMRKIILSVLLLCGTGCDYQNHQISDEPVFVFISSATDIDTGKSLDKNVVRGDVMLFNKVVTDDAAANSSCVISNVQQALLDAHNTARAVGRNCGNTFYPAAPPLQWDCTLAQISNDHNLDMSNNNFFSHTGSDGLQVADRATNAGYSWQTIGENIAAGQQNVDSVMQAWLASDGHCANIMRPQYQELGADLHNAFGSQYPTYWTANFGTKRSF